MKTGFKLKISDLLEKPGKIDEINFENIVIENIEGLDSKGISGELHLKSLNSQSIFAELENVSCTIEQTCDHCNKKFQNLNKYDNYTAKFSSYIDKDIEDDDVVFEIDSKNNINIEDMVIQNIKLQDDFVHYCKKCKQNIEKFEKDDFDQYENIGGGNVVFRG